MKAKSQQTSLQDSVPNIWTIDGGGAVTIFPDVVHTRLFAGTDGNSIRRRIGFLKKNLRLVMLPGGCN